MSGEAWTSFCWQVSRTSSIDSGMTKPPSPLEFLPNPLAHHLTVAAIVELRDEVEGNDDLLLFRGRGGSGGKQQEGGQGETGRANNVFMRHPWMGR